MLKRSMAQRVCGRKRPLVTQWALCLLQLPLLRDRAAGWFLLNNISAFKLVEAIKCEIPLGTCSGCFWCAACFWPTLCVTAGRQKKRLWLLNSHVSGHTVARHYVQSYCWMLTRDMYGRTNVVLSLVTQDCPLCWVLDSTASDVPSDTGLGRDLYEVLQILTDNEVPFMYGR